MNLNEEKQDGFWLKVAGFIVNKRKAIEILFVVAIIYSVVCINKVSVNQDITAYLPADSETRIGLSIMDEQFVTYGSAKVMISNITYAQADVLAEKIEKLDGIKWVYIQKNEEN